MVFVTHPFYFQLTLFMKTPFILNSITHPLTMVFDTLVCSGFWFELYPASLVILLVLEVISPCLTTFIKQNSYNQHFVNSYNVWMFWNVWVCGSPPPPYGYIIHGKHNSTDRSLYFINHQNPPFLFLDPPFIQTTLYTNEIQ